MIAFRKINDRSLDSVDVFVRTPANFESNMSALTLAIGQIERNGPRTSDDIARLRLAVSRLDTATSKAARAVQLGEER